MFPVRIAGSPQTRERGEISGIGLKRIGTEEWLGTAYHLFCPHIGMIDRRQQWIGNRGIMAVEMAGRTRNTYGYDFTR